MINQNEGVSILSHNGNEVVSVMTDKAFKTNFQGYIDMPSMASWYYEDPLKKHIKFQNNWRKQFNRSYPLYEGLLNNNSIIEVNGFQGEFEYEVPIYEEFKCKTVGDTSDQPYAGLDQTPFEIILNRKYGKGTTLSANVYDGEEIIVTESQDVELTGGGYRHTVTKTNNTASSYPLYLLEEGIEYTPTGHAFGEYGTAFATVQGPENITGKKIARFKLGSPRGVEGYVSGFADSKTVDKKYLDKFLEKDQTLVTVTGVQKASNGQAKLVDPRVGSLMEYMVHAELDRLTANSLMWQKAGRVKDANGDVIINEGFWPQVRRGKIIPYGRIGGIGKQHLKEAAEYVHQANKYLPTDQKKIHFKCGSGAYENVLELFQNEILAQINGLGSIHANILGTESILPKGQSLIESTDGTLENLKINKVRFTDVYLTGVGRVTIEVDPTLDYMPVPSDPYMKGAHLNGKSWTTYSMIIWDASSSEYSNNTENLPKSADVIEGGRRDSSVYLVKPKGQMTYWGDNHGRWDSGKDYIKGGQYKQLMQEFYAYNSCAVFVPDPSIFVMIELHPNARGGYIQ